MDLWDISRLAYVMSVGFSPDGTHIVSGSDDKKIRSRNQIEENFGNLAEQRRGNQLNVRDDIADVSLRRLHDLLACPRIPYSAWRWLDSRFSSAAPFLGNS
jgi:hypothetical protein